MHFLFRTLENKLKKKIIYCGKSGKVSGMCGGKFIARCQKIRGKSGEHNCIVPSWKTRVTLYTYGMVDGRTHTDNPLLFFIIAFTHFFNESTREGMYCGKSGKKFLACVVENSLRVVRKLEVSQEETTV